MALSADDIALFSPYEVSDDEGSGFTTAMLADYEGVAARRLTVMGADNLDADLYNDCLILMVCHLHTAKQGIVDIESTNDPSRWKWVKPGDTAYIRQIREIIKDNQTNQTRAGAPTTISRESAVIRHNDSKHHFREHHAGSVRTWRR